MQDVLDYLEGHRGEFLEGLIALLRVPSVSADPARSGDVAACAERLAERMRAVGLAGVRVFPTAGHPIVYGEWLGAPGAPTALLYGHYDVQPVDPLDEWKTPPFEPVARDGFLFGRGSADDKGQVLMHLATVEAYLRARGSLPLNLKVVVEGEEESGSVHFDDFLDAHRDLLRADVGVVSDTAMFHVDYPSICYGLRGLAYLEIELVGSASDLHSGTYGGAVANPAMVLARIISQLKDDQGRITVPGFYDDVRPLTDQERDEFMSLPFDDAAFAREIGAPALAGEAGYTTLERIWARPTLDVNGMWSGFTGEGAKTIIPARAGAKISCRLVPDQQPERIADLVERYLCSLVPPTVRAAVRRLHGGDGCLLPIDHPAVAAGARALQKGFGKRAVFIRAGGSIPPVASMNQKLGLPMVLMGVAQPDEHAHAPNERFLLDNFYGGMRAAAYLWDELAAALPGTTR